MRRRTPTLPSQRVSERVFDLRPRLLNGLLFPVLFGLALAAGVLAGNRSDSFWVGLLAFLVAWGAGRVLRRLIRGRVAHAAYEALWPAGATGFAILYLAPLGLPNWAGVLLAMLTAVPAKWLLAAAFLPRRARRRVEWAERIQSWDFPGLDDVVQGRWKRKED